MICTILQSSKRFRYSSAFELVSLLRESETTPISTNGEFMRCFVRDLMIGTNQKINTTDESQFIADLENLGLIKIKLSFYERYIKKQNMI